MRPHTPVSTGRTLGLLALLTLSTLTLAAGGGDPACDAVRKLTPAAQNEVLALARILAMKPAMAIDLSSRTNEMCLDTGGPVMAHFSTQPAATGEDVIYFIDAAPLVAKGLRLNEFPAIDPHQGRMVPSTWYRYEGKGPEPHHGMELKERTWLILAVDVK